MKMNEHLFVRSLRKEKGILLVFVLVGGILGCVCGATVDRFRLSLAFARVEVETIGIFVNWYSDLCRHENLP